MNCGFLDAGGRNNNHKKNTTTDTSTCLASGSDGILNDATPCVDAAIKDVSPSVVEETVAMECLVVNTPYVGPNPPLPTHEENAPTGNAPDKPFYATATTKPSRKKVDIHTLYTPRDNGIDVVVHVDSIHAVSERFANTTYGFFLGKKVACPVVANYIILKKWHLDENLLKEDVSNVPIWVKLHGVPITAFSEDGLRAIATKLGFKPQKEYRHVPKKPNANSSGNKKKGVDPTIELSNSNPFDILNSVDNDVEFGTNEGTTNLVKNRATLSGSFFIHVDNDGEFASNTPIGEKINKIERQICEGKLRLLDNDRNPLVPTCIVENDSEVEVVFDETANLKISTSGKDGSDKGYGTNSLLEQWRDSYSDNEDFDPYDDDMYENHDMSEHLQSIYDDLDITVRGRKKKWADATIDALSSFLYNQLVIMEHKKGDERMLKLPDDQKLAIRMISSFQLTFSTNIMTGLDNTLPPTPLSEKLSLVTHHHLLMRVPVKLDLDDWNYGQWDFFFVQLCESYDIDKYLCTFTTESSTSSSAPLTLEELKVDKIVLSWILFTLSDSLHARVVVAHPNLDARVNEEDVAHYALEGLPDTYNQVCGYMHWKDTFLDLKLVFAEEMRLKSKVLASPMDSFTPMVFVAGSSNNSRPSSTAQGKPWKPCFNFANGNCCYGDLCQYVHDANARVPNATSGFNTGRGTSENSTNKLLNRLLAQLGKLGINKSRTSNVSPPNLIAGEYGFEGDTS
nr:zinc knuckle CX2CX4HX4C [Tanacetum cinerariifolium]